MKNTNSYFNFDGNRILISGDLLPMIKFLEEIEKEIESLLGFDQKLGSIRKSYKEILNLIKTLAEKLKENQIDFSFTFSEEPIKAIENFKMNHPIRVKVIALFAYLETLLRLNFAYENKIHDGNKIRSLTLNKKVWESFYYNFCLNENNGWVVKNKDRASRISPIELRYLRNSLTHFFSVNDDGIQIADALLNDQSRKLEDLTNFEIKLISPEDLYEIIKGTAILMIESWSSDCQRCLKTGSNDFKDKIFAVNKLIENSGAILIKGDQIKFYT